MLETLPFGMALYSSLLPKRPKTFYLSSPSYCSLPYTFQIVFKLEAQQLWLYITYFRHPDHPVACAWSCGRPGWFHLGETNIWMSFSSTQNVLAYTIIKMNAKLSTQVFVIKFTRAPSWLSYIPFVISHQCLRVSCGKINDHLTCNVNSVLHLSTVHKRSNAHITFSCLAASRPRLPQVYVSGGVMGIHADISLPPKECNQFRVRSRE